MKWSAAELSAELGTSVEAVESLAGSHRAQAAALQESRARLQARLTTLTNAIERDVIHFDVGSVFDRPRALRRLRRHLRKYRAAHHELLRVERPLSQLSCSLDELLAASRSRLAEC